MRLNIHRNGKSCYENSINHHKNVFKSTSFSIQILEKLEEDGFINGHQDLQKLRLQKEDYWMKKLRTICPYGLNERVKNSNL